MIYGPSYEHVRLDRERPWGASDGYNNIKLAEPHMFLGMTHAILSPQVVLSSC
jgi:hypothetical protein